MDKDKEKRNKKTQNIDATKESILLVLKDTYDDIETQKREAIENYTTFSTFVQEKVDLHIVGKAIADQQKIYEGAIKQKLDIVRLQLEMYKSINKNDEEEEDNDIDSISTSLKESLIKSKEINLED